MKTDTSDVQERIVLMFVKSPEKGKVKSRLSFRINEKTVLNLYKCFVKDLLRTLKKGSFHFSICFYPSDAKDKMIDWLGKRYSYVPQKGRNLGERMKNGFTFSFSKGYKYVIIIGSDSPDLSNEIIEAAFHSLKLRDAVIGPSFDGGYYLIGFKAGTFLPKIFEQIRWGSETVFNDTLNIFKKNNYKIRILPKRIDIDRHDDLKRFAEKNRNTPFADSDTMRYLLNHKEILTGRKTILPVTHQ